MNIRRTQPKRILQNFEIVKGYQVRDNCTRELVILQKFDFVNDIEFVIIARES